MSIADTAELEPDTILPCELCGCAIEDLEDLTYLRAADLIAEWERADPRDAWRHTGEPPPKASPILNAAPEPYRPAASTVAAFWFLVNLDEPERLEAWLLGRPKDALTLLKLLETKQW
jgi:hypothetical protein